MRTLTTLGLVGLLSLGISSPAMCFVHSGTDSQQTGYVRAVTETWHSLSRVGTASLPDLHNQVLAENKDDGGKGAAEEGGKGQYAQGKEEKGTDAQDGDHKDGGSDDSHDGDRDRDHDHDHGHHHHPHSGDE